MYCKNKAISPKKRGVDTFFHFINENKYKNVFFVFVKKEITCKHIFLWTYVYKISKYNVGKYTKNIKGNHVRNSGLTCV